MPVYEAARANMIDCQLQPNKITDERLIGAFASIRRELFVPQPLRGVAYADQDLPLGGGRYLMAPMVAARLLQAVEVARADTVLVVGAGVGYEAALAAQLARNVIALEDDAELARQGRAALVEHGIGLVKYVETSPLQGYRARAPYNVIFFAGAVAEVPGEITGQLGESGRMTAVIRPAGELGCATLVTRTGGVLAHRVIFDAAIPTLPGFAPKPAFVF
jgi:protein-L-isoaspartate(D-aspartate) O-methyltransferase